ncbi:hypothetical protein RJ639_046647 [Escallonia herrerae]|uniref:Malectin-like domain-containing protein n=1 Tax=Escallonia herrerae TaxID=1293975 RepID=A0AA88W8A5_9ASTE|nr:hypothetical protein RJ639_046647 [Escallonia herrerae]
MATYILVTPNVQQGCKAKETKLDLYLAGGSRYYIRTFIVYDNFNGKSHSLSFDLSVEGNLVFSWCSPWQEDVSRSSAYSDLIEFVSNGEADICFYSIATGLPGHRVVRAHTNRSSLVRLRFDGKQHDSNELRQVDLRL